MDYQAINYLTEPLSVDALKQLLRSAGLRPQDALRMNEEAYRQFVSGRDLSDDEIVRIMADHPELIQRPIVARGDKAVLARPVDRLASSASNTTPKLIRRFIQMIKSISASGCLGSASNIRLCVPGEQ